MKHSSANTFGSAPRPRSDDVRTGVASARWWMTRFAGKSYSGKPLRVPPPPFASGGSFAFAGGGGVRQRLVRQHVAAKDRALHMRPGPDLGGPVDRAAGLIEHGPDAGHVRGADRFEAELLLAPPLDADALTGHLHRDHRGVEGGIIGAVMAVAAGAMRVTDGDLVALQAQNVGDAVAQRIDALGVRPDGQVAVADIPRGRRTARAPRARRTAASRSALTTSPVSTRRSRVAEETIVGGLRREPCGLLLRRRQHAVLRSRLAWAGAATAARCTTVSSSPTNATKSPTRTISDIAAARPDAPLLRPATPAWHRARAAAAPVRAACPGRTISWMNAAPLTFAIRSRRGHRLSHDLVGRGRFRFAPCPSMSSAKSSGPAKFQ